MQASQDESEEPTTLTDPEREDLDSAEPDPHTVTYSGQDFDVAGLVRRLSKDDILVPTFGHEDARIEAAGFQRAFVWRRPQMDRFVESILLGYPIPGIFLVRQSDKRYLVLDGQQRLSTLKYFTEGVFAGKEYVLENVGDKLKGLKYKNLPADLRRTFDDTFIQATIVLSDGSTAALESIYQIFERLNAGGTQLTPHEIRIALFAGPLVDFVEGLNRGNDWRNLYGPRSPRLRDQELVMRIVALREERSSYKRPLKKFLNGFAAKHRDGRLLDLEMIKKTFEQATALIAAKAGRDALRLKGGQVTTALAEAVLVGLMNRLTIGSSPPDPTSVATAITSLKSDKTIEVSLTRSTADEEQVKTRVDAAIAAFSGA